MKDTLFFCKTDEGAYRLVVFERDEETGAKSVKDIMESDSPASLAKMVVYYDDSELDEAHDDVDFGRATLLKSRALKVMESL